MNGKKNRRVMTAVLATVAIVLASPVSAQNARASATPIANSYRGTAKKMIAAALSDSSAWNRLADLTDTFGHRESGSAALDSAIDWVLAQMRADGLENVHGEPAMVPHWVRGEESAALISPRAVKLHMVGLGLSVGTPPGGITAPVMAVRSWAELNARASEVPGKIVLFDVPFTNYGETVQYRGGGAIQAARRGAVAVLIRSVSSASMQNPHTGAMGYDTAVKAIPAAALSVEDAAMLSRMLNRGQQVVVSLKMGARRLPDAPSRNVIAELRGTTAPDEVVVIGGHIDSWDVGQGAMDDGGGSVAAWEALKLMKKLGLRPRRTVRVVLWTNEESAGRGGTAYRYTHRGELPNHVMAMESDNGVFRPLGYRITGGRAALAAARDIATLLTPIGASRAVIGDPEADVEPLVELGVPAIALDVDGTKYFWYHHSEADTMDKLDAREMAECVAVMAVMTYVVADMPARLPRADAVDSAAARKHR
jgi:carboxypeptidase Q